MGGPVEADTVITDLKAEANSETRQEMNDRYGIRTDKAFGVPMHRMKEMAKPLAPNHELAMDLWASGWYEARTIAALVDDPSDVTAEQMQSWCDDFDNWAIVDTVCFNLFDRTAHAWAMMSTWAVDDRQFVKRAGFALLWALALHDRDAPDSSFIEGMRLIEETRSRRRSLRHKGSDDGTACDRQEAAGTPA